MGMEHRSSLELCNTQELGRLLREIGADAILATSKRNVGYLGGNTINNPSAHAPEGKGNPSVPSKPRTLKTGRLMS